MIIRDKERSTETRVAMRGGPGEVHIRNVCSKDDLYGKSRMYATMVLHKDCGVGYHEHENEEEIFLINEGRAIYNDNGTEYEVQAGDVMICPDGQGHAIRNVFEEDCRLTALIILK